VSDTARTTARMTLDAGRFRPSDEIRVIYGGDGRERGERIYRAVDAEGAPKFPRREEGDGMSISARDLEAELRNFAEFSRAIANGQLARRLQGQSPPPQLSAGRLPYTYEGRITVIVRGDGQHADGNGATATLNRLERMIASDPLVVRARASSPSHVGGER